MGFNYEGEPYEFDDTPLPDMMISYDPQSAIRPYFMRAEGYDEIDASLDALQNDYDLRCVCRGC